MNEGTSGIVSRAREQSIGDLLRRSAKRLPEKP